jgi:hypothetical protein
MTLRQRFVEEDCQWDVDLREIEVVETEAVDDRQPARRDSGQERDQRDGRDERVGRTREPDATAASTLAWQRGVSEPPAARPAGRQANQSKYVAPMPQMLTTSPTAIARPASKVTRPRIPRTMSSRRNG